MVKVLPLTFQQRFHRLPCYLLKGPLKGDFLDIYLTTSFGVPEFKNTSAMKVILILKMFKIESKSRKCKKKFGKYLSFMNYQGDLFFAKFSKLNLNLESAKNKI